MHERGVYGIGGRVYAVFGALFVGGIITIDWLGVFGNTTGPQARTIVDRSTLSA